MTIRNLTRYSIGSLLLVMLSLSCLLTYRLAPQRNAREFISQVEEVEQGLVFEFLSPDDRKEVEVFLPFGEISVGTEILESPWQVIWNGDCNVKSTVTFRSQNSLEKSEPYAEYDIVVSFANHREPKASITRSDYPSFPAGMVIAQQ